jgi:mRNA interferase MazF
MEAFVKGDIVIMPFPFTDLKATKKRPALVIATLIGDDLIVCQITGKIKEDSYVISLKDSELVGGKLKGDSYIRTNKIFTADKSIIEYKVGNLKKDKMEEVENKLVKIIKS